MLRKINRLGRAEFEEYFKLGRFRGGQYFDLKKAKTEGAPKFAVVVSKKNIKGAVQRNSLRRKIYRSIRENIDRFPFGSVYIILVKKGAENLKRAEIFDELPALTDQRHK